jgi:hypothetical protein
MDTVDMMLRISDVSFPGYKFYLCRNDAGSLYLQAEFNSPCSQTGKLTLQKTRKWQLSEHMTESELIQTAFKCVQTAIEHEAREQFKYKGRAVYGPHFDVRALMELCDNNQLETRG